MALPGASIWCEATWLTRAIAAMFSGRLRISGARGFESGPAGFHITLSLRGVVPRTMREVRRMTRLIPKT